MQQPSTQLFHPPTIWRVVCRSGCEPKSLVKIISDLFERLAQLVESLSSAYLVFASVELDKLHIG